MTTSGVTTVRERWAAVGDRLEALGLKLDLHYQQESTRSDDADPVEDGIARVGKAISDAFDALGEAVGDVAVRADVRDTGRLLVEAVNSTLDEVGSTIRRRSGSS